MASLLGNLLGRRSGSTDGSSDAPAFPTSPAASPGSARAQGANVWQSVFNPGRNYSRRNSRDYYDHVEANSTGKSPPTCWDYIVKAENLQRLSFNSLDKDGDGYLNAEDLRAHFGNQANVSSLIDQADKDKDGRISLSEFREMMQQS